MTRQILREQTAYISSAVAKEPTFALGDSNGISPTTLYTIIMVDTTCSNARRLHYARANFKNNFDITNIDTSSPAILEYIAPGSVGEKGDDRQYSFFMYTNPGRKEITDLQLPEDDEAFDVKQFQDDNGLGDATAGVGMVVKLGGEADCGDEGAEQLPSSLPTPRPTSSSTGSTSDSENATSPTSTVRDSNGGNVTSALSTPSESPANPAVTSISTLPSETPGPSVEVSTTILSSANGASSATSSAGSAEQTTNAVPGRQGCQSWGFAPLVMAVGFLVL